MTTNDDGEPPRSALAGIAPTDRLRLLSRAFEQSGAAIVITDCNNRIVAVNAAFVRLTGYAESEIVGRDPKFLASGETTPLGYAAMWQALAERGLWSGELVDRRKDGTTYAKHATISVLRADDGQVTHYMASFSDLSTRKDCSARVAHLARHDALTGLLNRHALQLQMRRTLAGAQRKGMQVGVLLIDLDRFKDINDSLGHQVGDRLLIELGKRLVHSLRASDYVARLGGDEFVALLPDVDNALAMAAIASKVRHNLADPYRIDEHSLYATPSIGIAIFPADGGNAEELIRSADTAMYHAKAAGRNNFQFFAPSMNAAARERLKLETALRQSLENTNLIDTQFHLEYQPQFNVGSGRIVGVEALARWDQPTLGQIAPGRFIPLAEETGLIQPLGDWVFWQACRQLREFKDQGIDNVRMAINLSGQQVRAESLLTVVRGALACYDLAPGELELEITEGIAMQNPAATIATLTELAAMGIRLAIDDFGTGYSSLAYLKRLPIQRLKLDPAFTRDIAQDPKGAALCAATVVLGHSLGLDIVAEAIETDLQRKQLIKIGCDAMQGFLYCPPLRADAVLAFMREHRRRQSR